MARSAMGCAAGARRLAEVALAAALVPAIACEPAGKRPLGAECDSDAQCESGLCWAGRCMDPSADDDGDGVMNGIEIALTTDPRDPDSDGDTVSDGAEVGQDPDVPPDSDGDGIKDALESAVDDGDGDCVADQFDPEDRDVGAERAIEVCQPLGLCAEHRDRLSATCAVPAEGGAPLWTCDPSRVPGWMASDTLCNGLDEDCDGDVDDDYEAHDVACPEGACTATGRSRCVGGAVGDTCVLGAQPNDTTCNGLDDDCDGATDEEVGTVPTSCGEGACADVGVFGCVDGELVDDCTVGAPAADDTVCNGEDDDCDGATDEDYVAMDITCGEGACEAEGTRSCSDGEEVVDCAPRDVAAADDATCDDIDGDCDGRTDEDFAEESTTCGVGACLAGGRTSCRDGEVVDTCVPAAGAATDADCDQTDDDCNGVADEDYVPTVTRCGVGACAATGQLTCAPDGDEDDDCAPGTPAASDTTCDGVDDDCDGATDESYVPVASTCGVGACARAGTVTCVGGAPQDDCRAGDPIGEGDATCDGVDDDCDGASDEGYVPLPTSCGVGACAGSGVTTCLGGKIGDTCEAGTGAAQDEDCDGVDDDCDEATDEDYVPSVTTCGVGGCTRAGELLCAGGDTSDTCVPGAPESDDATCDGVDDDCDNLVDEDVVSHSTRCGEGACAASGQATCINGEEVDDCVPDPPDCERRQCGSDGCGGSCGACDPPAAACLAVRCTADGACVSDVTSGCYIGGTCYDEGDENPQNDCQLCDPSADETGWSAAKRGVACGDEGNTCTAEICDGEGTCLHPVIADLLACNDGDGASLGDWCMSGVCHGFYTKTEARVTQDLLAVNEAYRRGNVGPTTPSVAGAFYYRNVEGQSAGGLLHYSTGAAVLPLTLKQAAATVPVALGGSRVVHVETMWEWVANKWNATRDAGSLRAAWGTLGDQVNGEWDRLLPFTTTTPSLRSNVVGAGRTSGDGGLAMRGCSSPLIGGASWTCASQEVATADYNSYVGGLVRFGGANLAFVNVASRAAPTSMKVLRYDQTAAGGFRWGAVAAYGRASTSELKDVLASGGWIVGVGASNKLWVTQLAGYTDIAVPGAGSNYTWLQVVRWGERVVVLGQAGTSPTDVALAYAPLDDALDVSSRWKLNVLWTGQTHVAHALVAPNDTELYVLGGTRSGASTLRAVWRYTTSGTPF